MTDDEPVPRLPVAKLLPAEGPSTPSAADDTPILAKRIDRAVKVARSVVNLAKFIDEQTGISGRGKELVSKAMRSLQPTEPKFEAPAEELPESAFDFEPSELSANSLATANPVTDLLDVSLEQVAQDPPMIDAKDLAIEEVAEMPAEELEILTEGMEFLDATALSEGAASGLDFSQMFGNFDIQSLFGEMNVSGLLDGIDLSSLNDLDLG